MTNLFSMTFNELCADFNRRVANPLNRTRTGKTITVPSPTGVESCNDVLRRWIINNGFPYFNDFSGKVWYSDDGENWKTSEYENCTDGLIVHECVAIE